MRRTGWRRRAAARTAATFRLLTPLALAWVFLSLGAMAFAAKQEADANANANANANPPANNGNGPDAPADPVLPPLPGDPVSTQPAPPIPNPGPPPTASPTAPGARPLGGAPTYGPIPPPSPARGFVGAGGQEMLPPGVELVSLQVPEGVIVEVLGPAAEPFRPGPNLHALRVGVTYRLKLSNLPERPGMEIFPAITVVGHLHRPPHLDPTRFPIRASITIEDIDDVLDNSQLATHVIYLENPDTALPVESTETIMPTLELGPGEDPFLYARKAGRIMAIVRVGARQPTPQDLAASGMISPLVGGRCPYISPDGRRCAGPCGPVCSDHALTYPKVPARPSDEYLCDGGDRIDPLKPGEPYVTGGVDPRDTVVVFHDGKTAGPKVLPSNRVCVYSPRFANARGATGAAGSTMVTTLISAEKTESPYTERRRDEVERVVRNIAPVTNRVRERASGLAQPIAPFASNALEIIQETVNQDQIAGHVLVEEVKIFKAEQQAVTEKIRQQAMGIKTAEGVAVRGYVEGLGQTEMVWKPHDVSQNEGFPQKPGLSIIKRVDREVAEPGDELTFSICYRNMGNTRLRAVQIVDSLLPRLEYIKGSAEGPKGTIFSTLPNRAGGTELKWELPDAIKPGESGFVLFKVKVL